MNTVTMVCVRCGAEYDEADQARCQEWIRSGLEEEDIRRAMIRGYLEYGECDDCAAQRPGGTVTGARDQDRGSLRR